MNEPVNVMKKKTSVFELPPKCPALADKITGIFGWRHTYRVSQKQKGIPHCHQYLHKTYSLNLPRKTVRCRTMLSKNCLIGWGF